MEVVAVFLSLEYIFLKAARATYWLSYPRYWQNEVEANVWMQQWAS